MALPNLIEIVPLDKPVRAEITVPGSKSITNRALILAALANSEVMLEGALWSEDTQLMVEALLKLGFEINVEPDPEEFCNRTITVKGLGGKIPNGGTAERPLELFVGNAGTAARFLTAFVCLGEGVYRLRGVQRMHERPQAPLFKALRELGYRVESTNDKLPTVIYGSGRKSGSCDVSIKDSSQFASALVLCFPWGGWEVGILDSNPREQPYLEMTTQIINAFPQQGGRFQIEPDASSGSYFWAVKALSSGVSELQFHVSVLNWPSSNWQVDAAFPKFLPLPEVLSRKSDLGDSIMTAIVIAPFKKQPTRFVDLGRLRVQETERVIALHTELSKCGARLMEGGEMLDIFPSVLHGAEIETYNDHRMAMCFAVLGLKVPGIKIKNPACVKKTFPNFFQKLAAPPPKGLGARILDAGPGRALSHDELFAD
jgi:3-phosphoshikimate 1-carboxyvinyltransferase